MVALNQRKNRLFLEKNCRCELCPGQATTRRACELLGDHVDPTALAKTCPGAACAYVGAVARNRRRRHANGHTAWAAAAAPSSLFAFVIRESSSIKGSLSLFDGCLFTFFFLEIVAATPRCRRRLSPAFVSGVAGAAALQAAGRLYGKARKKD